MIVLTVPRQVLDDYENVFNWCDSILGQENWQWIHNWPAPVCFFKFDDEKNATLFALKWMNN